MQWSPRVKPSHIRRLYKSARIGAYEQDLLREVGWGFYARCLDVLKVVAAVYKGELPCPQCGGTVYRPKRREQHLDLKAASAAQPRFSCPNCARPLTWRDCRDALRRSPKCFDCLSPLQWRYAQNVLTCRNCAEEWTWQRYRKSVGWRTRLPCPHCGHILKRPEPAGLGNLPAPKSEQVPCPRCSSPAVHARGKLSCPHCGHEVTWEKYRKRMKRRAERLHCKSCGHKFTWQSWRDGYVEQPLLTGGNPAAFEEFAFKWPQCKTPSHQMIAIDSLLHAVHGRGSLGPMLIDADTATVMRLLDNLAQQ